MSHSLQGQKQDVVVFRMVTKGTIEELRYLRQVYKVQLKDETIADTENPDRAANKRRFFRGVAGDSERKGELFGVVRMLMCTAASLPILLSSLDTHRLLCIILT
jgi:hypothetical protein